MNIYKVLVLACVVVFPWTVAAEAQKENAVKDEMKKLQGVWKVTKWFNDGEKNAPAEELDGLTFEFKADEVIKSDRSAAGRVKFVLEPTKNPKWIDLDFGRYIFKAIYKIDGDELSICMAGQDRERPTEFKANKKKDQTLFVMKKIKK